MKALKQEALRWFMQSEDDLEFVSKISQWLTRGNSFSAFY